MKYKTDGQLPGSYAKLDQIGLKIALGMENYPSNRMLMCYGPPGGGKSSLLYSLAGQYLRNGDEVWIVDAERAIDPIYFASYLPNQDGSDEELLAYQYEIKCSESRLKKELKAKEEEREGSDEQIEMLKARIDLLPRLIKAIKSGEAADVDPRTKRSLLLISRADYRMRNINLLQYDTLEEFEKEVVKNVELRKLDPEKKHKRLLIGVDSINYLLPAEVLERVTSSEGSNFVAAKYLHTLLPKLITKLSGTETSIFFIHQKTTTIKMNFWEQKSPIDDVATKGGSAAKFGATLMIGVERRKKVKGVDEKDYDTGIIDIPKAKLRGGSKGTFRGTFFLKESVEHSTMDFNEPFIMNIVIEEQYGIRKNRGKYYIPESLLQGHPEFDTKIAPMLVPFPKDSEEAENPARYFHAPEIELIDILAGSPTFEEECLMTHDIMKNV